MGDESSREARPLVLIIASDLSTHEHFASALSDECALLGVRSAALALRLSKRRPPIVAVIDEAVTEALDAFIADLRVTSPGLRTILLVAKDSDRVTPLAARGPVLCKPLDIGSLRAAVRNVVRVCQVADGSPASQRSAASTGQGREQATSMQGQRVSRV